MARRHGFTRGNSIVAHKEWSHMSGTLNNLDNAPGTVLLGPESIQANIALTLLRVRGLWSLELDATAADERVIVTAGMIIVSENAAGAGAASVPAPATDFAEDWLWWGAQEVSAGQEAAVVSDGLFSRMVLDSKAMRKLKPGENVVFVTEVDRSVDQGGNTDGLYSVRVLFGS